MPLRSQAQPEALTRPRIWAVGGGKGGVGKSVFSILLGLALARAHQSTVLIDADLGGANLHTFLGIKNPARTLHDFIVRKFPGIEDIRTRTQVSQLDLVCGAGEVVTMANPAFGQKYKIIQSIPQIAADHVILDLGAGSSYNTLDFFLIADHPIVVLSPEPVAIQNAYAFVRNAVFRKLNRAAHQQTSVQEVIQTAMDPKNGSRLRTIADLAQAIRKSHGAREAVKVMQVVSRMQPMIVTNMVKEPQEANAGSVVAVVAEKYLNVRSVQLGALVYDPGIERMVSQMISLDRLTDDSPAFKDARRIVERALPNFFF
jgi:flagellar biosynthesis protein FlhG